METLGLRLWQRRRSACCLMNMVDDQQKSPSHFSVKNKPRPMRCDSSGAGLSVMAYNRRKGGLNEAIECIRNGW